MGLAAAFLCNSLDDRKWSQLGITASHGAWAGTAVRDMGPWGALLLLPIAQCTATNSYTSYFWISPYCSSETWTERRDPKLSKTQVRYFKRKQQSSQAGNALFDKQRNPVCGTEADLGTGSDGAARTHCLL